MATIKALQRKVESLDTDRIVQDSFEETKDEFAAENREQLTEGFDKEGARLLRYRNNKYARVKNEMNPKPGLGNPDLKVTGSFHRGIRVEVGSNSIRIESTDQKNDELVEKYGEEIFGLGGEFKSGYLQQSLRPAMNKKIQQATGLKFK